MMCPLEEGSKLLLNISNKHIHHQIMRVVLGMLHIELRGPPDNESIQNLPECPAMQF